MNDIAKVKYDLLKGFSSCNFLSVCFFESPQPLILSKSQIMALIQGAKL